VAFATPVSENSEPLRESRGSHMSSKSADDPTCFVRIRARGKLPGITVRETPVKRVASACLLLLAFSYSLIAQQPQAGPPQGNVQIPAKTDGQIHLNVIVTDKGGNPVPGLLQQNFSLYDNKQQQPILSFHAPGESSQGEPPPHVILVIDAVNASFEGVTYEQQELSNYFKANGGKLAYPTSFVTLTDSGVQMNAAPNGIALAQALDQTSRALRSINRSQGFYGGVDRASLSINALQRIVSFEAGQPGRKLIIWIGPGWPILSGPGVLLSAKQEDSIYNTVASLTNALREAHITLYNTMPLAMGGNLSRLLYYEAFLKPISKPSQSTYGALSVQVLAVQSGGTVLNSSSDLGAQIRSCLKDVDAEYSISFAPQPSDKPNTFHAIDVKVDRPNLRVRTRTGYYDHP
jgi:VWFA-related protein